MGFFITVPNLVTTISSEMRTLAIAVAIGLVSAHAGAAFQGSTLPALVGAGPRATCQRASVSLKMVESYYDKAQKEQAALEQAAAKAAQEAAIKDAKRLAAERAQSGAAPPRLGTARVGTQPRMGSQPVIQGMMGLGFRV